MKSASHAIGQHGDDGNPTLVAESDQFSVFQVRWPVFDNVVGEGLLVRQQHDPLGWCVVVPDADQSPEQLLGLADGVAPEHQIARKLALRGMNLLIPTVVSRAKLETEDDRLKRADMTQREWIYRQAFHMGRHVIGYEIQRVLGAVDWFKSQAPGGQSIGVAGYGEGGLIAMHAAAADERIDATLVSGYFDSSDACWTEPIYRNVWRRAREYGNAQIAALILPRGLVIEYSPFPAVDGHKGQLATPDFDHVKAEFDQIENLAKAPNLKLVKANADQTTGPYSEEAVDAFAALLGNHNSEAADSELVDKRRAPLLEIQQRQQRCVAQLEQHVQSLVRTSEHVRDQYFMYAIMPSWTQGRWSTERRHATDDPQDFIEASKAFREKFAREAIGRFDASRQPLHPRTRKIIENDKWTAYDVVLNVYDDFFAWGTLVVPKGLEPGERRPVVVCQHGRNGLPRDTIDAGSTAYNDFAAKLAERGFITFAPHNLYRGEDEYRWLDRKANAVGCSLFSFILASHAQILDWLNSLDFVDGDRIAFYGLSYGGETAVRVPPVLEKYCLSICSGDFNQWTRKVAATDQSFSFMNTIEWEMPYWNLGHTFDYAEMTYLMFPRPFMVERGHHDRVGRDQWVAHEFAKVRHLYAQFGKADQVEIEFFQGGHSINGERSFEFLHQHLNWPKPNPQ
ncbi:MAG: dienelactone hydrolase family protein [Pirellulaceae bacterium]